MFAIFQMKDVVALISVSSITILDHEYGILQLLTSVTNDLLYVLVRRFGLCPTSSVKVPVESIVCFIIPVKDMNV